MGRENHAATNISIEPVPYEWQGDPLITQMFNALRIVSLVQLAYVVIGYIVVFTKYLDPYFSSKSQNILDLVQAPGGISILTLFAAITLRFRFDAHRTLSQVKIYSAMIGLDLLLWMVRAGYTMQQQYKGGLNTSVDVAIAVERVSSTLFAGILLVTGLAEGLRVASKGTKQQYSLLNDNEENLPPQMTIDLYALCRLSIIQLSFAIFGGILPVIATYVANTDSGYTGTVVMLLVPSAGLFTILGTVCVFLQSFGTALPTYYSIMMAIDLATGLLRFSGAVIYGFFPAGPPHDSLEVTYAMWAVFPIFYWIIGIITAYRTRVHLEMNSNMVRHVEGIFGI